VAVKLNRRGFEHAKERITTDQIVLDERDDWSEHQPSAADETWARARYSAIAGSSAVGSAAPI